MKPTACVALLLSFVLALEGCSFGIAHTRRIGPDPERAFKEGASREDIERKLGQPIATETLADGNVRAAYEYTARVGRSTSWVFGEDAGAFAMLDVRSLFLLELIFMPVAYFTKPKYTYQKEYVFSPDGTIVEDVRECIQERLTKGGWDWCSNQKAEPTVAEPAAPAPEDKPAAPAPEPEP